MSEIKINIADTIDFWNWFSENQNEFGKHFENQSLLKELDLRITSLGDFSWEVGPGSKKPNALVISPGGHIELLKVTKEIIDLAPDFIEWEFHHAKPPKVWDLKFSIQDENENEIEIDANDWQYVLLKYPDNKFEIILAAAQMQHLSEESKHLAAEIVLDGLLGEQKRMELIDVIDVVRQFEDNHKGKAGSIVNLLKHLDKLI